MTTNIKAESLSVNLNPANLINARLRVMEIISGPKIVTFTCRHCGTKFRTTEYRYTRKNHYSASCPCCPYSAWAP